ncbi:MAG: hypothetical protein JWN93_1707 [Hyphomicrobiales bacterium]|nr:hypothetical protein [Hyphomicrobiales bacterium]
MRNRNQAREAVLGSGDGARLPARKSVRRPRREAAICATIKMEPAWILRA